MQIQEVKISKIQANSGKELADHFQCVCNFCNKIVTVYDHNYGSCYGPSRKKFYCPFCLRNNHHFRSSRHILPLSYRAIIGYYYHSFYDASPHKIYFSQIEDFIKKHENTGLQSPVFSYDPSTFLWYIDFNRVGNGYKKAPFKEVFQITELMIECFDIKKLINSDAEESMKIKFQKALELFYQKRKRPKDRKMLIPTLENLTNHEKNDFFEKTRNFTRGCLILK